MRYVVTIRVVPQANLNGLDILEEIVSANEWLFDRANDDELIVELSGRWCHYRMFFVWQKEIGALQFSCQFDMKVQDALNGDPDHTDQRTNRGERLA